MRGVVERGNFDSIPLTGLRTRLQNPPTLMCSVLAARRTSMSSDSPTLLLSRTRYRSEEFLTVLPAVRFERGLFKNPSDEPIKLAGKQAVGTSVHNGGQKEVRLASLVSCPWTNQSPTQTLRTPPPQLTVDPCDDVPENQPSKLVPRSAREAGLERRAALPGIQDQDA